MRAQIIACLGLIVFASFDVQATVSADELVKFDSAAYAIGKLQQRLARERGEMPTGTPATAIEGYLSKPDGSGPFPAVLSPRMRRAFGKRAKRYRRTHDRLGLCFTL